jgi:TonB family protein
MGMRILSLLLALGVVASAAAQDITGTLHNPLGAVIPGARVLLMNEDYVKQAETTTGERGEFAFEDLKPALYFVQAKKPMFQITQRHVKLEANESQRIALVASVARGEDRFSIAVTGLRAGPPPTVVAPAAGGQPKPSSRLSGKPPAVPDSVRQRGVHGTVTLYGVITTEGTLANIVALESPDAELERACVAAFREWRYTPMTLDGVPVASDTLVVFEFKPAPTE